MFQGFFSLGGTEIANSARFLRYVNELVPGLQVEDCYDCADLGEILGDGPYNSPLVDQPDWYAVNQPDSAEFCGFYPLEVEGIDDGTRTASVTELALDGGMVGAPRYASREIRVSGLLVGATDAALHYGLRWLAKALEGSPCRDATGCTGDHLCYYAACPPICEDSPALDDWDPDDPDSSPLPFYLCDDGMVTTVERACSVDYERTLYQVSLTSGPTVVEQYNSTCGYMVRVEFTLVAGVPFAYSTAISAVPGVEDLPVPEQVADVACVPGTDVVVRTNLATNPIPSGNAAVAGGGWQASGTGFTVTPDTDVEYADGGGSVRIDRTAVAPRPNLATNPDPADDLAGWGWLLGQGPPAAPMRTNWATNPSFELASATTVAAPVVATNLNPDPRIVTTAFTALGSGVASWPRVVLTEGGPDDDAFVQYTAGADQSATIVFGYGNALPVGAFATVTGGQGYTGSMFVRFGRETQVRARLDWRDDALTAFTPTDSDLITVPANVWTQVSVSGVAAAGATKAGIGVLVPFSTGSPRILAGDPVGFAHRMIVDGTDVAGTYFDGSSTLDAMPWWAAHWTGTADASTSVLVPVGAGYPAAQVPEAFDVPDTFTGPANSGSGAVVVQSTYGAVGGRTLAVVPNGTATTTAVGYPAGVFAGSADKLGWEAGKTYTVSAAVILAGPQQSANLMALARAMRARIAGGTNPRLLANSEQAPNEAGRHRVSLTFTMPDDLNGGNAVLELFCGSDLPTDTVWWDQVLIEEASAPGGYFDGSFPDAAGIDYEWTGDPHDSPSTAATVPAQVTTELVDDGDGPGQDTYQRTTVVNEKVGGSDGVTYTQAAGPGVYTLGMSVRSSQAVRVQLVVTALDSAGQVLATSSGPMLTLTADDWFALGPVRITAPTGTTRLRVAALMPATEILAQGATFDAAAVRIYSGIAVNDPLIGRVTYVGQHDDDATTIAVTPGVPLTVSVYVGASVDALAQVTVTFYNAAGIPLVARSDPGMPVAASPTPVEPAVWQRVATTDEVAPAAAAYVVVDVAVAATRPDGAQVGDRAWLSSVLVEEASAVLSYFDGSTAPRGNVTYEWTGSENESTSQALLSLPSSTDGGRIVDPDCPPVPEPPRPPMIDVSCVDTPDSWIRYQVSISADLVPQWFDAVPIIRLQTGDSDARQVRVRFYPNPLGAPVAALDPCSFCGEFVVTYIPANSLMTIDGIRQWVTVTSATGVVSTANHLLASTAGGPVSWPLLGCGVGYTLVVDVSPTGVADLSPQICLAARA